MLGDGGKNPKKIHVNISNNACVIVKLLSYFDLSLQTAVFVDASPIGPATIITQKCPDGTFNIVIMLAEHYRKLDVIMAKQGVKYLPLFGPVNISICICLVQNFQ